MINNLETTSLCDIKYKIVFLGNMLVGKTSIIERFIHNSFDENKQVQHMLSLRGLLALILCPKMCIIRGISIS